MKIILICCLISIAIGLPSAAAEVAEVKLKCSMALLGSDRNGHIDNFDIEILPVFRLQDLIRQKDQLLPQNEKFILGQTGQSRWVVEHRKLQGKSEPQIFAVKYFKDGENEVQNNLDRLLQLYGQFKRLGLLPLIDVVLPLEVGPDYMVFPYIEAEALSHLSLRRLQHLKPPAKYQNPNIYEIGPPTKEDDPQLYRLWQQEQFRIRRVVEAFKVNGFKTLDRFSGKSWRKEEFLQLQIFESPKIRMNMFTIRNDILVTTDGRFVIVDPY